MLISPVHTPWGSTVIIRKTPEDPFKIIISSGQFSGKVSDIRYLFFKPRCSHWNHQFVDLAGTALNSILLQGGIILVTQIARNIITKKAAETKLSRVLNSLFHLRPHHAAGVIIETVENSWKRQTSKAEAHCVRKTKIQRKATLPRWAFQPRRFQFQRPGHRSAIWTYKTSDPSFSLLHFWSNLTRRQVSSTDIHNGKYGKDKRTPFCKCFAFSRMDTLPKLKIREPAYARAFRYWRQKIYKAKIVLISFFI